LIFTDDDDEEVPQPPQEVRMSEVAKMPAQNRVANTLFFFIVLMCHGYYPLWLVGVNCCNEIKLEQMSP
jgi:hypothetical protein